MNSRERVRLALTHQEPDRVPCNFRPSAAMTERLRKEQGNPETDFAEFFRHDIRYVGIAIPNRPKDVPLQEWTPHPSPQAIAEAEKKAAALKERGLMVCGSYNCGVFEQAKHWLGDSQTLIMPRDDPHTLRRELERITEWKAVVYGAYATAGVDIVWIGDDLGTQKSLVMSPTDYREWYRPYHAHIVQHIRNRRPDVRIAFHCCGHVTPLIPDLIDLGIDILEAVQPECMDLREIKRQFGSALSFWGGIGTQSILARRDPRQVADGIREILSIMAPGGGYIAAPCHTLTEEVPWESALAFHDAVRRFGTYPFAEATRRC